MSSNWSALHAHLVRSVNRHSNLHIFNSIPTDGPITGFRDPAHLLGWLHDRGGEPAEKNSVLAELLDVAGRDRTGSDLAVQLLILALWPGLTTIRRRLRLIAPPDMQALDADVVGQLSLAIRKARGDRINRIAATLLRNVERDLRRAYQGEAEVARTKVGVHDVEHLLVASAPDDTETILRDVQAALGSDGNLLAAVHIIGWSQLETAMHLGISHEAARKRCQRAMARLKQMSA